MSIFAAIRYEEMFYSKLGDKKRRERMTDVDMLGQHMLDAGNSFGPGTSYGKSLTYLRIITCICLQNSKCSVLVSKILFLKTC